jgi:hypothetical protein
MYVSKMELMLLARKKAKCEGECKLYMLSNGVHSVLPYHEKRLGERGKGLMTMGIDKGATPERQSPSTYQRD